MFKKGQKTRTRLISGLTLLLTFVFAVAMQAEQKERVKDTKLFQDELITITGKVTDNAGAPLPGVNVYNKADNMQGTITDFDGNYTLQIDDANATIVFSFMGFDTQEVSVEGRTKIDIVLQEETTQLQDVVVVAYGKEKKEVITSSITSIKQDKLVDVTTPDVSTMLQGKASGVMVAPSTGSPGSSPQILIRGMASLNGNVTPLWVVDGVIQHDVPVVNPNDIESVSILKDASATSLYGSRGANGVIIVTTKQAQKGEGQIKIDFRGGFNQFNMGKFNIMNSQQLYDYNEEMGNDYPWFTPELLNTDYNWIENGTNNAAALYDLNLSFSKSTEKLSVFIGCGAYTETGTLKGKTLNRYTYRTNLDIQMNSWLKLMPKISFSYDYYDHVKEAPLFDLYLNLPWDYPYDKDGKPINAQESTTWIGRDKRNYLYDQQWNYSSNNTFNFSINFDFDIKLASHLNFISTNNFSLYRHLSESYTDPRSVSGLASGGLIENSTANHHSRLANQMLRYSNVFGDDHSFNILGAYEYNDYKYWDFSAIGSGIFPESKILKNTSKPVEVDGEKYEYALQSFIVAANYSYGLKYFAKASVRADGASNFGPEKRYGMFFSLGGGWNIHYEEFYHSKVFTELKFRISYGSVGNRPSSHYPYQGTYRVDAHYMGIPGAILEQYGNPDLSWEKSYETNIAIDTRLFDKVNLTVEYYHKNTSDLLYTVDLPDVTGFTGYWENVGGILNKGFETQISTSLINSENVQWNLGFNIGINRNEITELFGGHEEIRIGSLKVFKIGEDANTWYMRKWAGVNPDNGDPLWEIVDPATGDVTKSSDYNEANLQVTGTSSPDFIGGFNTDITFKNISLAANFTYAKGGFIYNETRERFDSDGAYPTYNQMVLAKGWSRWSQPGDNATHPKLIFGGNNLSYEVSSRFLEDASYLRMNNLTVGYNIPQKTLDKVGVSTMRIYFAGDNLFTITQYSGTDPTVGGIDGEAETSYPIPRRFIFGLNIAF